MTDERDDPIIDRLRNALDDDADDLDPRIVSRLAAARQRALARRRGQRRSLPVRLAPAVAFASVAVIMVVLLRGGPSLESPSSTERSVLDFGDETGIYRELAAAPADLTVNDIELIEELEFFEWLEAGGDAG